MVASLTAPKPADAAEASFNSSVVSLLKTIVGAGMLAMPFAMSKDGILLGVFLMLFAGITSCFGLFLQGYTSQYVPRYQASFFSVSQISYPALGVVFDLAIAIKCFGVGVSYLILVGDLLPQIVATTVPNLPSSSLLLTRELWISVFVVVVIAPLCYKRNLDSLRFTSLLGLTAIAYMALLVYGHFLIGDTVAQRGSVSWVKPESPRGVFSTFPVIVYAYTGQQNMFSIINEAANKSLESVARVAVLSVAVSGFLYITVGMAGYLSFGSHVTGNVITMYESSVFSTVARVAFVLMVVFSYPLVAHPCRISANNILQWLWDRIGKRRVAQEAQPLLPADQVRLPPLAGRRYVAVTTGLLIAAYLTAVLVDSFETVLAVVGATGSVSISFILPGLFGYKLIGSSAESAEMTPRERILKYLSLLLTIWGFFVMVVCLTLIFLG